MCLDHYPNPNPTDKSMDFPIGVGHSSRREGVGTRRVARMCRELNSIWIEVVGIFQNGEQDDIELKDGDLCLDRSLMWL